MLRITIADGEVTIELAVLRETLSESGTLLAKPAVSEHLHRGRGTVVTEFVGSDTDVGPT